MKIKGADFRWFELPVFIIVYTLRWFLKTIDSVFKKMEEGGLF